MDTKLKKDALIGFLATHPWPQQDEEREEAAHAAVAAKAKERNEIADQVAAFLARGGEIQSIAPEESHAREQPIKRTKKEQIAYKKRFNKVC